VSFFSRRRRHTRFSRDWSSDVCSSDLENDARYEATFMLTIYDQYFDYYDKDTSSILIRAHYPRLWDREYTEADEAAYRAAKGDRSEERRVGIGWGGGWVGDR